MALALSRYLPENVGFYKDMDAIQSLEYIADLNGMNRGETRDKIQDVLNTVGLLNDQHKKVSTWSRGIKQRLGWRRFS